MLIVLKSRVVLFFFSSNSAFLKSSLILMLCCSFSAFKIICSFKDITYHFLLTVTRALKKGECQD